MIWLLLILSLMPVFHQFKVSVMEVHSPTLYDFRITFTELRLMPLHIHDLQLNGSREAVLTDKQLLYQTQPLNTDSSKIVFQVCGNSNFSKDSCHSPLKHEIHEINTLTFRHRASCILGQAFHCSPENAFYIFNQQIYFII